MAGGKFEKARQFEVIGGSDFIHSKGIKIHSKNWLSYFPFFTIHSPPQKSTDVQIQLPPLPRICTNNSIFLSNDNKLISMGGTSTKCFVLDNNKWIEHSSLKMNRYGGAFVKMPTGFYAFGGYKNGNTSEYLPISSNVWQTGPDIATLDKDQNQLNYYVDYGTGHAISNEELIIICRRDVIRYNVMTKKFSHYCSARYIYEYYASVVFNGKLIITGGEKVHGRWYPLLRSRSTTIVDLTTKDCKKGGPMNIQRSRHKMEVVPIDGTMKVIVFGGEGPDYVNLDSLEIFDEKTATWKMSTKKLNIGRYSFGHTKVSKTIFYTTE